MFNVLVSVENLASRYQDHFLLHVALLCCVTKCLDAGIPLFNGIKRGKEKL
jgi:hypothetical protein